MDATALYDDVIVARSKAPRHAGVVDNPTAQAQGNNPVCGDRVRLSLRVDGGQIAVLRHNTRGCAICAASADLMADVTEGRRPDEALEMAHRFSNMLESPAAPADLSLEKDVPDILRVFLPLRQHRSRLRCATLPWTALGKALDHD